MAEPRGCCRRSACIGPATTSSGCSQSASTTTATEQVSTRRLSDKLEEILQRFKDDWEALERELRQFIEALRRGGAFSTLVHPYRAWLAKRADGSTGAQNWHCGITYRGARTWVPLGIVRQAWRLVLQLAPAATARTLDRLPHRP